MACCGGCKGGKDATLGDLLRDAANDLAGASIRLDAVTDKARDLFDVGALSAIGDVIDHFEARIREIADGAGA
jgi:hypothetical protein